MYIICFVSYSLWNFNDILVGFWRSISKYQNAPWKHLGSMWFVWLTPAFWPLCSLKGWGVLKSFWVRKILFLRSLNVIFELWNFYIIKIKTHVMIWRKSLNETLYKNKFILNQVVSWFLPKNDYNCRIKDVFKKTDKLSVRLIYVHKWSYHGIVGRIFAAVLFPLTVPM